MTIGRKELAVRAMLPLIVEALGAVLLVIAASLVFVPAGVALAGGLLMAAGWAADH